MSRPAARTPVAVVSLALVVLLTGCTGSFLVDGGGSATPMPSPTATPDATPTPEPTPEPDYDCDGLVLNRPGAYVLGDCGSVTIEGTGIRVTVSSVAALVIRGDGNDVVVEQLGDLDLSGQDNEIVAAEGGHLIVRGDDNLIVVDGRIASVNVTGNENEVRSGLGIGAVSDNGLLNQIR